MTIPTREEINVDDSLDERAPWCMDFLGKTVEEAEEMFRREPLYYQEGLMWMGPVAFRYYIHAMIRYIQGDQSSGDSDTISCLAGLLEFRSEYEFAELVPVSAVLSSVCDYAIKHQDRFDLDPEIHGDVPARLELLRQKFVRLADPTPAA